MTNNEKTHLMDPEKEPTPELLPSAAEERAVNSCNCAAHTEKRQEKGKHNGQFSFPFGEWGDRIVLCSTGYPKLLVLLSSWVVRVQV